MVSYILIFIISYLIGSVNFSVLISKKMAGFDVREKGSGNAGTTNVLRSVGKKAAALTLIADILKGIVAVLIAFFVRKNFFCKWSFACANCSCGSCIADIHFQYFSNLKVGKVLRQV